MFARTPRLLLRPPWTSDAPALARAIGEECVVRNLATAPWPYTLADAEAFVARERPRDEPVMLAFLRTEAAPELVGAIGLGRTPDGDREIGYWIARPHWGKGFATEAAAAMVGIARDALRLDRLRAGHFLDNPASGRVLVKTGFRPGAIVNRYSLARGGFAPTREFVLDLAEEAAQPTACDRAAA